MEDSGRGIKRKKGEEGFQPVLSSTPKTAVFGKLCEEIDSFMAQEGLLDSVSSAHRHSQVQEQEEEEPSELELLRAALAKEQLISQKLRLQAKELHDTNNDLSNELQSTRLQLKKFKLEAENELSEKNAHIQKLTNLHGQLPTRARAVVAAEPKEDALKQHENLALQATISQLTKEKSALQAQLSILESNTERKEKEQEKQFLALQHENELLRLDVQELQRQKELLEEKLELTAKSASLLPEVEKELSLARLQLSKLSSSSELGQSISSVATLLQGEHARLNLLEDKCNNLLIENKYLRESAQNGEVLNEKIRILTSKLQRKELESLQLAKLRADYEELLAIKNKWEDFFGNLNEYQSEEHVLSTISDLQKDKELLVAKVGQLQAELKRLQILCASYEGKTKSHDSDLEKCQKELSEAQGLLKRQQILAQIKQQEYEYMQSLVASYQSEEANESRVGMLMQQLAEKDKLIKSLEGAGNLTISVELEALKAEVKRLHDENNALVKEVTSYEQRLAKGEYDPSTTKVLHMVINPSAQILRPPTERMSCEKTDIASVSEIETKRLQQENEALRQGLAEKDKSEKRLMQVCQKKISAFRETMCKLFGYKISYFEEQQQKIYRLQSIYSEREKDELIFLCSNQGKEINLELVATDFSNTLDEDISAFLWKCHSIPAFLSHVTLNLFNKKTFKIN